MIDLISRQAAIDIVLEYGRRLYEPVGTPKDNEMYSYGRGLLLGIERNLKQLPSAEPKKGKWTIETIGEIPRYRDSSIYEPIYKCSCCGRTTESYVRFEEPIMPEDADFPKYCPNCGASMEVTE